MLEQETGNNTVIGAIISAEQNTAGSQQSKSQQLEPYQEWRSYDPARRQRGRMSSASQLEDVPKSQGNYSKKLCS